MSSAGADPAAMSVLYVIPARGGSKGIPGKNLRFLDGRPLLAYSIASAQAARRRGRIVVSTDDEGIAQVATGLGAEVITRPAELATDQAATDPVLEHVVTYLRQSEAYEPDLVVLLQPTSPLRPPELIDACIERLLRTGADSLLTVFEGHSFFWRRRNGRVEGNYDPARRPRRQEIAGDDRIFLENGSVYVTRRWVLLQEHSRLGGKVEWFVMSPEDSVEIDEPLHLQWAEFLLRLRRSEQVPEALAQCDVRLVVLDFDGVVTDNRVWVSESGQEAVACDRSDGLGIELLRKQGIQVMVLSTETNPVVSARCKKLAIECLQGLGDKAVALRRIIDGRALRRDQVIYVGNDINDLVCRELVGCFVAVADAHPLVLASADLVLRKNGGQGAVRELSDLLTRDHGSRHS